MTGHRAHACWAGVLVLLATAAADWPPAPNSGGMKCVYNADCGIPAANCDTLREKCESLSGTCSNGVCVCKANDYGCPNCAARAVLVRNASDPQQFHYSTEFEMLDGSGRTVDLCSVPHGGAVCKADLDCRPNGLCIGGVCVCSLDWMCDTCSMTQTDLLYGLTCNIPDGGGACSATADCGGHGRCVTSNNRTYCSCNPLWACPHCSRHVPDLAINKTTCPNAAALG